MASNVRRKIWTIANTSIAVWQERDRLTIALRSNTGRELAFWADEAAHEAITDGFLSAREAILGNLERGARQGGALHRSALEAFTGAP
jgi:hypothetical protein